MKKTYLLAGLGVGLALTAASAAYAASGSYEAWRNAMGTRAGRATTVVNEQNFDKFTEMHRLMAEGKYDEAQKVRTDLGLGSGNQGRGCGMNNSAGRQGGCGMRGAGTGFVDANNNGICDRAEQNNAQ
ncbi:hypothetical protein HGA34_02090 [Candidatus Falkowbacteria bacterium]|nr:hypothetical protein [Candidatus Falkowbacteria bacterium]